MITNPSELNDRAYEVQMSFFIVNNSKSVEVEYWSERTYHLYESEGLYPFIQYSMEVILGIRE